MKNISWTQFIVFLIFVSMTLFFCLGSEGWFPILDSANLGFHEFGHPFFGAFSHRLMVYGGTIGQLVFPSVVSLTFYQRRESFPFAVGLLWIAENIFNIARYMADARAQQLPLVGGGEHDWTEILSRFGWLPYDTKISAHLTKAVVIAVLILIFWLYSKVSSHAVDDV